MDSSFHLGVRLSLKIKKSKILLKMSNVAAWKIGTVPYRLDLFRHFLAIKYYKKNFNCLSESEMKNPHIGRMPGSGSKRLINDPTSPRIMLRC
jgi:hypothetical protein